jgi:hypothetical protein
MLSCRDLANRVASDYIDEQLGWRARLGVRWHLAICDNCRRFIGQLQQVRAVIRARGETPSHDTGNDEQLRELATHLHAVASQKKNSSDSL